MSAALRDIARDAAEIWPDYRPTRLIELPALARAASVGRVLVKLECERPFGNFKVLGGMVAGLRALARAAGVSRLSELRESARHLPHLVCASAGNHGLAVAAAARWAGTGATIYLPETVVRARAARIESLGARIVWTRGTYDDAVHQAADHAGLVIADTSSDPDDQVVRDVMEGYRLILHELAGQLGEDSAQCPTHLFVQAGVGGLAAALAEGVRSLMRAPRRVLVVEPQAAACVAQALAAGRPVRVNGELRTRAEMLACGLASAAAVEILRKQEAAAIAVSDDGLQHAERCLRDSGGPCTTPSGAAGLAGLLLVGSCDDLRKVHQLDAGSCVLLVVTESAATILGTS